MGETTPLKEPDLTDRSAERGGDTCSCPARNEISLFAVVPEVLELGEGRIKAQNVRLALVGFNVTSGEGGRRKEQGPVLAIHHQAMSAKKKSNGGSNKAENEVVEVHESDDNSLCCCCVVVVLVVAPPLRLLSPFLYRFFAIVYRVCR